MTTHGRDQPDPDRVQRLLEAQAWHTDQIEGINRELREALVNKPQPLAVIGQGMYARTIGAE